MITIVHSYKQIIGIGDLRRPKSKVYIFLYIFLNDGMIWNLKMKFPDIHILCIWRNVNLHVAEGQLKAW
jgi:hypothetical protein